LAGIGLFAALSGWSAIYQLTDMGRTVYSHRPGVCRRVHGPVQGAEDIEVIRAEGIAFITSGVLYLTPRRKNVKGKIFLFDFNQKLGASQLKATYLPITGDSFDPANFHPHGISHWVVNGVIRLYVINHDNEFNHSIEIFDYDPSGPALIHNTSLKHPTLIRPNNLVAVGPDKFIFTNDGVTQSLIGNLVEIVIHNILQCKCGTVYYWDGQESHLLLSKMAAPNGIAYDANHNKLFVSEINHRRLHVYELSKNKRTATHLYTVDLHSACDNLFVHTDGSVFAGCHPLVIQIMRSIADCDGEKTSASQALRVQFDKDYKTATLSEPYANDGTELSGSTIVVLHNNQMLIGTICKGLLHCEIADPAVL
ncbi:hypothetical protein PMAYCL1PPCAC_15970, partial [Pristionchus mayeri]